MHELSLCLSLVDLIENIGSREGMHSVTSVLVEVGEISGVETGALLFCFEAASQGSIAKGASLFIEQVPAQAKCRKCRRRFPCGRGFNPCPDCGTYGAEIISGRELILKSLEGETEPPSKSTHKNRSAGMEAGLSISN